MKYAIEFIDEDKNEGVIKTIDLLVEHGVNPLLKSESRGWKEFNYLYKYGKRKFLVQEYSPGLEDEYIVTRRFLLWRKVKDGRVMPFWIQVVLNAMYYSR